MPPHEHDEVGPQLTDAPPRAEPAWRRQRQEQLLLPLESDGVGIPLVGACEEGRGIQAAVPHNVGFHAALPERLDQACSVMGHTTTERWDGPDNDDPPRRRRAGPSSMGPG
ncbi:MAG: hypothetical protein A2138_12015 [Deltaproteobacteria bacterium RBG_16_71_12]|nr:MAG: hypothetical protein A2138_12015 [Deltaproteobacteria bacterium RBG_16_71_12]